MSHVFTLTDASAFPPLTLPGNSNLSSKTHLEICFFWPMSELKAAFLLASSSFSPERHQNCSGLEITRYLHTWLHLASCFIISAYLGASDTEYGKVLVAQSCPIFQPHGLQPTRLLCPWNSPGKNTGVGSHSLLQNPHLLHCRQVLYHLSHQKFKQALYVSCEEPRIAQ